MSMLSAQVEKLRKAAQTYRTVGNHELEQLLLDAADTISELRDMAQQAQSENAELRELVADMWRFTGAACKKYPRLFDQSAQGPQVVLPNALDFYEQRMRELGVEVDGCASLTN